MVPSSPPTGAPDSRSESIHSATPPAASPAPAAPTNHGLVQIGRRRTRSRRSTRRTRSLHEVFHGVGRSRSTRNETAPESSAARIHRGNSTPRTLSILEPANSTNNALRGSVQGAGRTLNKPGLAENSNSRRIVSPTSLQRSALKAPRSPAASVDPARIATTTASGIIVAPSFPA